MKTSTIEYQYNIVDILSKYKNHLKPSKKLEFLRENIKNVLNCDQSYNVNKNNDESIRKEINILEKKERIKFKYKKLEKEKIELEELIKTKSSIEKSNLSIENIENSLIKSGMQFDIKTKKNMQLNFETNRLQSLKKNINEHRKVIKEIKEEIIQEEKNLNKIRVKPISNRATIEFIYNIEYKNNMNLNFDKKLIDKNSIERIIQIYKSSKSTNDIRFNSYTDFLKK
ncbi:hypothetical protein [Proteus myxofaciens]|uniref:Uncharacterized protein n=1 Tax=Proteus myxofaciens ATCC 19692 TaxID=1354337 RepID=A0A198G4E5_9GAMM|nr:hypothetical protein [Proteus myxofaciens]OAT31619.1 hypothetical protein M983_1369 [Proteus myxofaciens ATCC 19692]